MIPGYIELFKKGELKKRASILKEYYKKCSLCPHHCGGDRTKGETGICRSGTQSVVASFNSHQGEEPPISGKSGSGTIFFSGCSGRCIFCQNYPISQLGTGRIVTDERLAEMMIELQNRGCHNINLVSPTHFIPSIVSSLYIAVSKGLRLPIVYNTGGYEREDIIKILNGIIDIYLPDTKYADNKIAERLSGFHSYVEHNRSALKEMFHQVKNLKVKDGVAVRGLIVRHLILPDGLSGTEDVLRFLSESISSDIYVSLMDQYFPANKALHHEKLSRRITEKEYFDGIEYFTSNGLHNGWIQKHFLL
ncbi:radical SAM protein [Candidatus Latescibacterota bacterium]